MSCFRLPNSTCVSLEREFANFWWEFENEKRKMHWTSWDFLCKPKCNGSMGFKKLEIFNKALLTKQVWRIIRHPESLVAKVLKARYFKHSDIMQATIGNNPSYIWRSLCWSREVLKEGMYWRIGDGQSVNILQDKWIPTIRSTLGNLDVCTSDESKVSTWISEHQWCEQTIRNVCPNYIAQEIMNILISDRATRDTRYWRYESKGQYSVKSGYRIGMGIHSPPENHSNDTFLHTWWRFFWVLSIPPKILVFWWRVYHNIIPTEINLSKHHVPVSGWCPLCHNHEDSTSHAIIYCPAIQCLWKGNETWRRIKQLRNRDMQDICLWLMAHATRNVVEEFVCQAWMVCVARYRAIHDNENREIRPPHTSSYIYLVEYQQVSREISKCIVPQEQSAPTAWQPPTDGFVRQDVDVSFRAMTSKCGLGGVIRQHDGQVLVAFGQTVLMPEAIVIGELFAIKEGIRVALDRGFTHVRVCSDSLLAVQAVMDPSSDLSYVGSVAQEILLLSSEFVTTSFHHMRRTANEVAHSLAKFVLSSPASFIWVLGTLSFWLDQLVLRD